MESKRDVAQEGAVSLSQDWFPPSHKWRVVLKAMGCSGSYHAHFVLCDDSFIQRGMHSAPQGQRAPATTSSFFLCLLFSFQTQPCLLFGCSMCMYVRMSKESKLAGYPY